MAKFQFPFTLVAYGVVPENECAAWVEGQRQVSLQNNNAPASFSLWLVQDGQRVESYDLGRLPAENGPLTTQIVAALGIAHDAVKIDDVNGVFRLKTVSSTKTSALTCRLYNDTSGNGMTLFSTPTLAVPAIDPDSVVPLAVVNRLLGSV